MAPVAVNGMQRLCSLLLVVQLSVAIVQSARVAAVSEALSTRGQARQLASVAYSDAMKWSLIHDTLEQMAGWGDRDEEMEEALALNSSQYHWHCTAGTAKLKGGKLALVVVHTSASKELQRQYLRQTYAAFQTNFDIAYAVTFPSANETEQKTACAEAEKEGDMLLVNCREADAGQMYYVLSHLAHLLESVWKGGYKYVIKVDGGTLLHLPHLEQWMTAGEKSAELASAHVLFGPRIQHYYKGAFMGMSSELLTHVMSRVEAKWIGGHHEHWLVGLWMRLYGPASMIDVGVAPEQHVLVPPHEVDVAKTTRVIQAQAKDLLFFHVHGLRYLVALRNALFDDKFGSGLQPSRQQSTEQPSSGPPAPVPVPSADQTGTPLPPQPNEPSPVARPTHEEAEKMRQGLVRDYLGQRWLNDTQLQAVSDPLYRWSCDNRSNPWRVTGNKLGLFYVFTRVDTADRRMHIRHLFANFTNHYDVVYAVGHPGDHVTHVSNACTEQNQFGDLILVDCKEGMNDGKGYHTMKALREMLLSVWKGGYKYVVKMDDDSYVHFPHLYTWMTQERASEFSSSTYVLFGPRREHYYSGPFIGWSEPLFVEVAGKMEARYSGGHHEDWLLGFWARVYGPDDIVDINFNSSQFKHFESYEKKTQYMIDEVVQRASTLICFHCKHMKFTLMLRQAMCNVLKNCSCEAQSSCHQSALEDPVYMKWPQELSVV